ncbi:GNAT family N-acetyltransferase [Candidatus Pacearchaeota archaeon]|nr:GNAT family N-acetyltransferase [Candidatus Pacearchaeota archaeon]
MIEIRKYQKGDEKGIILLWQNIFDKLGLKNDIHKINEQWWKWRVDGNPIGKPKIYLALDNGKIVAHHMAERLTLLSDEKEKIIYQGMLSMVEKKYKGMLLLKMINLIVKETKKEDALAYGFPNNDSLYLFEKMGWKNTGEVPVLGRYLNPLLRVLDTKKLFGNYKILDVKTFNKDIDKFLSTLNKNRLSIKRSSDFLNWRYSDDSQKRYKKIILAQKNEIKGFAVFRCGKFNNRKVGIIMDIFAENKDYFKILLSKIVNYFSKEGMEFVTCYMLKKSPFYNTLKWRGFFQVPKFLLPKRNFFLLLNGNERESSIENWDVSYGDWDSV